MDGVVTAFGLARGLTGRSSQRLPSMHGAATQRCSHCPGLRTGQAGLEARPLGEECGYICLYFLSIFHFFFLPVNLR